MGGRVPCQVPGCRRTQATDRMRPGDDEHLCARHWALIPKGRRRAYALARRRGNVKAAAFMWPRLVAMAITRAAGL